MRTIKTVIILLFFVLAITSCDRLYHIGLINNSKKPIVVISPPYVYNCVLSYPDSIIPLEMEIDSRYLSLLQSEDTILMTEDMGGWDFDNLFCNHDTLSIFIFDSDSVNYYSWDTVKKHNLVLQRYDFSRNELENMTHTITYFAKWIYFPPTEAMKHIHMWPPYGTYDENGRKKEKKR